jgi:hypothetical protein
MRIPGRLKRSWERGYEVCDKEIVWEHENRVYLALDMNQRLCPVKIVMKMWGHSCLDEDLLVSEES